MMAATGERPHIKLLARAKVSDVQIYLAFFGCALALANTQANAQAGATPPSATQQEVPQPTGGEQQVKYSVAIEYWGRSERRGLE